MIKEKPEVSVSGAKTSDIRYGGKIADAGRGRGTRPGGPGGPGGRAGGGKPKDIKKTIKYIMSYVLKEKPRLMGALVCVLVSTVSTLAASYMLRPIINTYIVPTDGSRGNLSGLAAAVAFMFLIYIAGIIATSSDLPHANLKLSL